jgi:hypothetical protein
VYVGSPLQIDEIGGSKPDSVADASGNLHVPDAYRTTYQYWEAGRFSTGKLGGCSLAGSGCKRAPCRLCIARDHRRLSQERKFS